MTGTLPADPGAPPEPLPPVGPAATAEPAPPPIADGLVHPLDPRHVTLERIVGAIVDAVISSVAFAGIVIYILAGSPPAWVAVLSGIGWLAGTLLLAWASYRWPEIEHRHASWRLDAQGIEIREGVYWRSQTTVPRSRVQHTDVSQGPIERSLGLGTLVIYTAGTEHAQVQLKGLDHSIALRIRDHLLPREQGDAV